ncbi:D-tyrosyl-tRNA(Tyr) deacylase [candidate division KSB1 bacterium]|nr:D-tyrosyl-tRNA(Tyr) deacylase [candidate division KSB1 bacterium]
MRLLIQRVKSASVTVEDKIIGRIDAGLVIFIGIKNNDTIHDAEYLANKVVHLRIFTDAEGKCQLSALDKSAELLVISQFTLYADCRRGRRPSFTEAAPPAVSQPLYEKFVVFLKNFGLTVEEGQFGAMMLVSINNDGPVTVILDSNEK